MRPTDSLILNDAQCLLVGGGGFIGTHLCKSLLGAGARVKVYGRRRQCVDWGSQISSTVGTLDQVDLLRSQVDGAQFVFHLLGGVSPAATVNGGLIYELEEAVAASVRLFELCKESGVKRIVFVSSGGTVYGVPAVLPIPEVAATNPISSYGVNKLAIEKYLHFFSHAYGVDYAVMRVANPFGPYQTPGRGQGVVATLLKSALDGRPLEIWGDGLAVRDYVYVGDVADALMRAACYTGPERIFNVGSGVGRTVLDIARDVARFAERPDLPMLHRTARKTDVPVNVLDISLIRREFDWQPTTGWMEALSKTAEWIRNLEK